MANSRNRVKTITVVDTNEIVRNSEQCCIITKTENKDYKIVFDKRVIIDEYHTVPYVD